MPDSPKVHLLVERPAAEASHSTFTGPMLVLGRTGGWWPVSCAANIHDDHRAWMPLPTATDLTVEDVQELIVMAETKAYDLLFEASESFDSDVVRDFTAFGKKTLAAVAKVKAALGGGVS